MILVWIIYLIIACVSGVFFVLYKDLLSLILFCVVIAVPIILFVIHIIASLLTKVEVDVTDSSVSKSEPAKIIVTVKNNSPFAVTHIKMTAKCTNLFLNTEHDCKFVVSAKPFTTKQFTYEMASQHIGNIEFKIKKAYLYDFFSMFCTPKKLNIIKIISVLPNSVPITSTLRPNNYFTSESDSFSTAKAGDDPSEVFNIRDYTEGDKLNKIHWKLTSKMDHYMVKDYSLPVSEKVIIYLDLQVADTLDETIVLVDSMMKTLMSVSDDFTEKGIVHYIGWYNSRQKVYCRSKIASKSDIMLTTRRVFSDTIFTEMPEIEKCDLFLKKKYSHIIFMSTNDVKQLESQFVNFDLQISLLSIVSVGYNKDDIPPKSTKTEFIPVIPDNEAACLYDIRF